MGEAGRERDFSIDNLLVRNHFILEMSRWTGLAPWEFAFLFQEALDLPSCAGPDVPEVPTESKDFGFGSLGFRVSGFGFQISVFRVSGLWFVLQGLVD